MLQSILVLVVISLSLATRVARCDESSTSPLIRIPPVAQPAEEIPVGESLTEHGAFANIDRPAEILDYVEERPSRVHQMLETVPTVLTWPDEPLATLIGWSLKMEHVRPESGLEENSFGVRPTPPRPDLLVEWNERFLSTGFLARGIELPTGAVWRPAFWVFGQYRTAIQYTDSESQDTVAEWANRLDLFGQVNLTGTERVLVGLRPLDEERGNRREFVGYDFHTGTSTEGWNADVQTVFFEGDFQELFPNLDPYDFMPLDWGFSFGRMPLLAQQGLLVNEDMLDAATLTRDTLSGNGVLDFRGTGVYAWRGINRNSPTTRPNDFDPESELYALLTESDVARGTINLDGVYVRSSNNNTGDLLAFGASMISRQYGYHNTYNTSLQFLASYPTRQTTPYADQGELLFGQFSWTPHHTNDVIYANSFWAIDQFTSPARGPLQGGPLGQTGILFSGSGIGRFNAPLNVRTNDTAGASLGYQLFFDDTRRQVISEIAGFKETKGPSDLAAIGWALRLQSASGQHAVWILDGFLTKREGDTLSPGARCELLVKF